MPDAGPTADAMGAAFIQAAETYATVYAANYTSGDPLSPSAPAGPNAPPPTDAEKLNALKMQAASLRIAIAFLEGANKTLEGKVPGYKEISEKLAGQIKTAEADLTKAETEYKKAVQVILDYETINGRPTPTEKEYRSAKENLTKLRDAVVRQQGVITGLKMAKTMADQQVTAAEKEIDANKKQIDSQRLKLIDLELQIAALERKLNPPKP